jgi:SAM-dependent methyltransferase
VLDTYFREWENMEIHESSPSNKYLQQYASSYSFSQYFDSVQSGNFVGGINCQNLESMSFEDNTFDLFITQDVLEHVFHPEKALKEIMRVLKPGGAHVFTAPKHRGLGPSYARALLINDNIQYLAEVEYHGNPVGDGRALVTWDFGDDFEELVSN